MEKTLASSEINSFISDRRRIIEITAVSITALGKFVFMDFLNLKLPFILTAVIGWFIYIVYRKNKIPTISKYWGLTFNNFKGTTLKVLPFGMISLIAFFGIGYYQESIKLTWHIIPILILYPIWGTIQQLLTIGLVAGNLKDLNRYKFSKTQIILITATLFSIVHYPNLWLMLGTFILAIFYGYIYLKEKNLYVLGLFHGWLGAIFYYTVVGRDPFIEIFCAFVK